MTAFIVVTIKVKDPELFARYASGAAASMAPFGAELIARGSFAATLAGLPAIAEPHTAGVVRFPSRSALDGWFASEAYQSLIPLRDRAVEMNISVFESVL